MNIFEKQQFYTYDVPFQMHFAGLFDSVFISWFPFFKIACKPGKTSSFKKSFEISLDDIRAIDPIFNKIQASNAVIYTSNKDYPERSVILTHGQEVSWNEVKTGAGFQNFSELYKALKTSIGAYNHAFSRRGLAERLQTFLEKEQFWQPGEGAFDPITLRKIYSSFMILGKPNIIVEDEFLETKRELYLPSLTIDEFAEEIGGKDYYIYDIDRSLLFVTEWDSFFHLICSSSENVERIVSDLRFEGFYADSTTIHGWEHLDNE